MADTDWFADVEAALDDSADETALAAAPENESVPEDEGLIAAEDDSPDETVTEDEPSETEEIAVADVVAVPPQAPNWDSPDNPYAQEANQARQLKQLIALAQQQRGQQASQETLRALADDDPQRITEIQKFLSDQQAPLQQRVTVTEQELEVAAKLATVIDQAVEHLLPPEMQAMVRAEVERMMALPGGPEYLQRDIQTRKAERAQHGDEIAKLKAENAALRKQSTARQQVAARVASGADRVDSGTGGATSGFQARWDAASNFDEAFDAIFGGHPA